MYLAEKDEVVIQSDGRPGKAKSDFQSYADALWWGVVSHVEILLIDYKFSFISSIM